eukprot:3623224-Pyramimonas_sp.AAC.1
MQELQHPSVERRFAEGEWQVTALQSSRDPLQAKAIQGPVAVGQGRHAAPARRQERQEWRQWQQSSSWFRGCHVARQDDRRRDRPAHQAGAAGPARAAGGSDRSGRRACSRAAVRGRSEG